MLLSVLLLPVEFGFIDVDVPVVIVAGVVFAVYP